MGRLSELFEFLNAEDAPDEHDMRVRYAYIHKNDELMELRKKYRKELKEEAALPDGVPWEAPVQGNLFS